MQNFNIITWLFTDPCTAGGGPASGNSSCPNPEQFHFYIPWLIFNILAILVPLYYAVEGRKRFVGHHGLNKYLLDKFFSYLWPIGLVGLVLEGIRKAEMAVFSWRVWRYGWLVWLVVFAGFWLVYLLRKNGYRAELASYRRQRIKERYLPPIKPRRRQARTANAR